CSSDLGEGGQVGGDHRTPRRHRLGHDDPEALATQIGGHHHRRGCQCLALLVLGHAPPELDSRYGRTVDPAHHDQFCVGDRGAHFGPCRQQDVETLARVVATEEDDAVGLTWHIQVVGGDVDGVGYDDGLSPAV